MLVYDSIMNLREHLKILYMIYKYKIKSIIQERIHFLFFKMLCSSYLYLLFGFNPKAETRSLNLLDA